MRVRITERRSHRLICSFRAELDLQPPRPAIGLKSFSTPAKRILCDLAERPANWRAVRKFSFLHDFVTAPATNQISANAIVRIKPVNSPGLN
jgi:hypothetical protein